MRQLLDIPAPAKLNLFLHITGRRADGYHQLQSIFQLVDWCDTLHVEKRSSSGLSREDLCAAGDAGPPLPAEDLCLRAARALQEASGCTHGAHIILVKRIAQQAGLGGGSSDAASTLMALNRLWGLNWPRPALMRLGARLGADVPFFLGGHNAWVEGIGESLTPVVLPQARYAIVKPAAGIDTAAVYQASDLKRATPAVAMDAVVVQLSADPTHLWGRNDLQAVAVRLCPDVGVALKRLAQLGLTPRMTGSGSAVFAPLASETQAAAVSAATWPAGWQIRVCRSLPQHPLAAWLKDAI